MGVPVQNNVNILRHAIWRYVLQAQSQSITRKVDHQWPIGISIAVSAHNRHRPTRCAQFIQDDLGANIAQMPDFVGLTRQIDNLLR